MNPLSSALGGGGRAPLYPDFPKYLLQIFVVSVNKPRFWTE